MFDGCIIKKKTIIVATLTLVLSRNKLTHRQGSEQTPKSARVHFREAVHVLRAAQILPKRDISAYFCFLNGKELDAEVSRAVMYCGSNWSAWWRISDELNRLSI